MALVNKNTVESGLPVWQLPVHQSSKTDIDWIHPKSKYHCFCGGWSLCDKYKQDSDYFETDIESGQISMNPYLACNKCYNIWKKDYNIDEV